VACSERPVAVDRRGLIRLSNALTRVEERLSRLLEGHLSLSSIPDHNTWIVTMWHFGIDSLHEFTGEKFEMTWEEGKNAMIRIYSKDMKGAYKTRIRMERQECPNKTFEKAMKVKLAECRVRYLPMYKGSQFNDLG
jgi:hypothetical protein